MTWLTLILIGITLIPSTQQQNCPGVTISQKTLDENVIQVEWFNNEQYVYAATKTSLYVSKDEGQTWTVIPLGTGTISEIYLTADESKQFVLEFQNKLSVIWQTSDHGTTWKQLKFSELVFDLYPHPTDANWVFAHTYTPGCLNSSSSCSKNLHLSQDFGETWKNMSEGIQRFSWGNAGKNGIPKETAFQLRSDKSANISSVFKFERTSNLFKSIDKTVPNALDFGYYYGTLYVAQYLSGKVKLLVSNDNGDTLKAARFPSTLDEHSYTIINDIQGLSYIAVDHSDWKSAVKWTNVYVTDFTSDAYVLSQEYVTKDRVSGRVDFSSVSLDGVQIANVYDLNQEPSPTTRSVIVSVITWDNGGQWRTMEGPTGSCPSTSAHCHIHLQGRSSGFAIETNPNAVGLIVGTGNTGDIMDDDALNTYISRDAGLTWNFVTTGTKVYQFSDHGGLLLLAEDEYPTKSVLYSWDKGTTLTNCTFDTKDKLITWIGTAPSGTSQNFLVIQSDTDPTTGSPVSIITHLDFSSLHQRQCANDDYENWRPSDGSDEFCLLGREIQFNRRKTEAKCFNPESYETQKITSFCPCTQEDYGCDFCYEDPNPEQSTGQCVNKCGYDPTAPPPMCNGHYKKTRGYRLVAGDQCQGGLNLNPQTCDCNGQNCVDSVPSTTTTTTGGSSTTGSSSGSSGPSAGKVVGILFLMLLISAVLCLALVYYLYRKNPQVQAYVDEHIPKNWFGRGSSASPSSNVPYSTLDPSNSENVEVDPFVDEEEATELNDHEIVQMKTMNSHHDDEFNPRGDGPSQPPSLI